MTRSTNVALHIVCLLILTMLFVVGARSEDLPQAITPESQSDMPRVTVQDTTEPPVKRVPDYRDGRPLIWLRLI